MQIIDEAFSRILLRAKIIKQWTLAKLFTFSVKLKYSLILQLINFSKI
jgi:hypothetical protein